jgi:RimJ/RimL family protein N-acetyltransferase
MGVGVGVQPTLPGDRLRLRPWADTDVDDVEAACQDPAIQRWTTVPSPYRREDAVEFVTRMAPQQWADGVAAHFAVESHDSSDLLGSCGLVLVDHTDSSASVGYWVASVARGRGVARRALDVLSEWALTHVGLVRLDLIAAEENRASRAVAEGSGFTLVGPCPVDRCPLDVPAVLYERAASGRPTAA